MFHVFLVSVLPKHIPKPLAQTSLPVEMLDLVTTLLYRTYESTHKCQIIMKFQDLHDIVKLNLLFCTHLCKSDCYQLCCYDV